MLTFLRVRVDLKILPKVNSSSIEICVIQEALFRKIIVTEKLYMLSYVFPKTLCNFVLKWSRQDRNFGKLWSKGFFPLLNERVTLLVLNPCIWGHGRSPRLKGNKKSPLLNMKNSRGKAGSCVLGVRVNSSFRRKKQWYIPWSIVFFPSYLEFI